MSDKEPLAAGAFARGRAAHFNAGRIIEPLADMSPITSKELLKRTAADERARGAIRVNGRDRFPFPDCKPGECLCTDVTVGSVFTVYRCVRCGGEEWL